jgi:tetratricopeptide (TPR) repeat protein
VIANATANTFKGKTIDAKEIGKELGVRYVLEGSVQRDGTRVRVNAQLIDAQTGAHLWADRFEEDVSDLFKLQDQVVARLANSLGFELVKAEAEKAARSKNPDAIDLTMRGWALAYPNWHQPAKDTMNAARALFEQALQIDPNYSLALAEDADTYSQEYVFGWADSKTDYDAKVLDQANRAIALDSDNVVAHEVKSAYLMMSRRFDEAVHAADAGLAVDPNYAWMYGTRASAEISLGLFDQAKSDLRQAMRLSPRDPGFSNFQVELGDVEIGAGRPENAINEYKKALDLGNRDYWTYANLAAAYALLGKTEEAKPYLAEALRLNPKLTVKWFREHAEDIPSRSEGLRKVGLPEE